MGDRPFGSVVIPTRNRRNSLEETLLSLAGQETGAEWEVIIVDNGSTDGTRAWVEAFARHQAHWPLKLWQERSPGVSRARNRGIVEAEGEVLVFIDDDVTCRPGFLAAYEELYDQADVSGGGGRILPRLPPETPDWLRTLSRTEIGGPLSRYDFGGEDRPIDADSGIALPFGANMSIRRAVAIELSGFREDLGWGRGMVPSEDSDFARRAMSAGRRLNYVPNATVEHRILRERTSWSYYRRWQIGYGRGEIRARERPLPAARWSDVGYHLAELRWLTRRMRKLARSNRSERLMELRVRRLRSLGRLLELLAI